MAIIAHLDMDAFFAAVEERNNPQWRGMPIVVGSDPRSGQGRGVVSTANYAARKFGIRSALPIRTAWKLAKAAEARGEPETIFLPGHWHTYSDISKKVMSLIQEFSPQIQQTGVDEAYFDVSFAKSFTAAAALCRKIKDLIKKEECLTASVGIGPNKLIAKIAANFQKPDGLTSVIPENVEAFLEPMPVRALPGVGPKTEAVLKRHGINYIRDLQQYTANELAEKLGQRSPAPMLQHLVLGARGIGSVNLEDSGPPKSISEQQTFSSDTRDPLLIMSELHSIADNLMRYLAKEGFKTFRTVTVTTRFADFETHTYAHTLKQSTNSLSQLKIEAVRLLLPFLDHRKNPKDKLIRLIGLRIEKLS